MAAQYIQTFAIQIGLFLNTHSENFSFSGLTFLPMPSCIPPPSNRLAYNYTEANSAQRILMTRLGIQCIMYVSILILFTNYLERQDQDTPDDWKIVWINSLMFSKTQKEMKKKEKWVQIRASGNGSVCT